jgi:uncharacterized protein
VRTLFADTFYWVALTHPADARHADAVNMDAEIRGALIVTTDEVLTEFLAFHSRDAWLRDRAPRQFTSCFEIPTSESSRKAVNRS